MSDADDLLSIDELAERGGVSRRTVRYYIQRGLLPPPQGLGRGKHYAAPHLATLIRIRELQEAGVGLEEIGARLDTSSASASASSRDPRPKAVAAALPLQASWTRVALSDEVEVHIKGRRLTDEQLRELTRAVQTILEETS